MLFYKKTKMHKLISQTVARGGLGIEKGAPDSGSSWRTISIKEFTLFYIKMDWVTQIPKSGKLTQRSIPTTLINKPILIFTYGSKWREQLYPEQVWSRIANFWGQRWDLKLTFILPLFQEMNMCVWNTWHVCADKFQVPKTIFCQGPVIFILKISQALNKYIFLSGTKRFWRVLSVWAWNHIKDCSKSCTEQETNLWQLRMFPDTFYFTGREVACRERHGQ